MHAGSSRSTSEWHLWALMKQRMQAPGVVQDCNLSCPGAPAAACAHTCTDGRGSISNRHGSSRLGIRRFDKGQQHKSWKAKGAAPVKGGELKTKVQVSKDRQKKVREDWSSPRAAASHAAAKLVIWADGSIRHQAHLGNVWNAFVKATAVYRPQALLKRGLCCLHSTEAQERRKQWLQERQAQKAGKAKEKGQKPKGGGKGNAAAKGGGGKKGGRKPKNLLIHMKHWTSWNWIFHDRAPEGG
eukprot:1161339-Pelagomonas_calceolata.AAC.10